MRLKNSWEYWEGVGIPPPLFLSTNHLRYEGGVVVPLLYIYFIYISNNQYSTIDALAE
jgi:hypothetical protein